MTGADHDRGAQSRRGGMDRLLAAAAQYATPPPLADAWRRSESAPPPQPTAGQCWRLRWQATVELAVVASADRGRVSVLPVTQETAMADDTALVVPPDATLFGYALVMWPALETSVGEFTLERCIGEVIADADLAAVRAAARRTLEAQRAGALPRGWRPGAPAGDAAHPRHQYRARLADTYRELADADWIEPTWSRDPARQQPQHTQDAAGHQPAASWRDLPTEELARILDVTPRVAIALLSGRRHPTPEQDELLAASFGPDATAPPRPAPDPTVVAALDSPQLRAELLAVARAERRDEISLRRELARADFAAAARQTTGDTRDVTGLLILELKARQQGGHA